MSDQCPAGHEHLEELETLFFEAVDLPEEQRDAFLDRACCGQSALRCSLVELLRADGDTSGWIEAAPWSAQQLQVRLASASKADPLARPQGQAGRYRLMELAGRGGMGSVWRARPIDNRPDRDVAVKFIPLGLNSQEALRRFRREEQALARLEHRNIARLYDSGTTDDGRPFLVMEFIDGIPIDEYCRTTRPEIDALLDMIRVVCHAVHFAHSNFILHGDIKPANVLVATGPEVKLLDFGIARLLSHDGESLTVTASHPAFTPRYASPEQIRGEPLTTASDVYSLGVMLYELLVGQSPYGPEPRTRRAMEQAVLETTPTAASAAIMRTGGLDVSIRRGLARRLRGDLDAIVAKALAKSPAERYASAEQLAEDIHRYQQGLPIVGRRPGLLGRAARAIRRHQQTAIRAAIAATAAMTISAAALSYLFMAPRWARERVRQAHRAFLTPQLSNSIWVLTFNNSEKPFDRARPPLCPKATAERALSEYDAALRLDPSLNEIRLERATVALAAAISQDPSAAPDISPELRRAARLTCDYALNWHKHRAIPDLSDDVLDRAERMELRCLGLLAVLCGEPRDGLRAWSRIGDFESDPLVESLLGVLFLANEQPQRAYPRLLSAYREFPDLGYLCTYLADAAISVGDTALAGRLIERAKALDQLDPLEALHRVRLKYCLATRQDEAAAMVFSEPTIHINPLTWIMYARHLFDAGNRRPALALLAELCGESAPQRSVPAPAIRALLELTQRWWTELDDASQIEVLANALAESPESLESLVRVLTAYDACVRRARQFHRQPAMDSPRAPLAADPLLVSATHRQLIELCKRLEIRAAHRWSRFRHYPAELRTRQLDVWRTAVDPSAQTIEVEESYDAWLREQGKEPWPGVTQILPPLGDRSFGRCVDLDGDSALVLSSGIRPYRLVAGRWEPEQLLWSQEMRVLDAVLEGDRILALAEPTEPAGLTASAIMFTRDAAKGRWTELSRWACSGDDSRPIAVGLSGPRAFIYTGREDFTARAVHLYAPSNSGDGTWMIEQEIRLPRQEGLAGPSRICLDGDTLVLHSGWVDCGSVSECANTLSVFRRGRDAIWRLELERLPPKRLSARALWRSTACSADVVVATAAGFDRRLAAAPVFRRAASGVWMEEADLCGLISSRESERLGLHVAIEGSRVAMSFDHQGNVRGFHLFEHGESGWRHIDTIEAHNTGFSDAIGRPAMSGDCLIFGAPGHDAKGFDCGGAFIVDLRLLPNSQPAARVGD